MFGFTRVAISAAIAVITLFLSFVWVLRQPPKTPHSQETAATQEAAVQENVTPVTPATPVVESEPVVAAPVVAEATEEAVVAQAELDDIRVNPTLIDQDDTPEQSEPPVVPTIVTAAYATDPSQPIVPPSMHRWLADRQQDLPLPQYTPEVTYPIFIQSAQTPNAAPAPMSQQQFFDVFFNAAEPSMDANLVTRDSKTPSVAGLSKDLVLFYKLATHRFASTKPRAFIIQPNHVRLVMVPYGEHVNVLLYQEAGQIKLLFPQSSSSNVKGKQNSLLFTPYEFQAQDQTAFMSTELNSIHGLLYEKCKELMAVKEGKLDPVVTYLMGGSELEMREVPGKLKHHDFTKELKLFDQLFDQASDKPYRFYSRNLTSLYSAVLHMPMEKGKIYRFEFRTSSTLTAEYEQFVVFWSGLPGYNIILGRRKTDKYEYVQLAAPDFPDGIGDVVEKGERPFLKPRTTFLSMDDKANQHRFKKLAADTGITLSFDV